MGAYTLAYDAGDRVSAVNQPFGVTQTFTYDGTGNRTAVQDSFGGVTTSGYDAADRVTFHRVHANALSSGPATMVPERGVPVGRNQ